MNVESEPFEVRAERVLACVYRGIHNCDTIKKVPGEDGRWEVNHIGQLSTFDFDCLTRLVISAHDNCVRATVLSSGSRMVKIWIHDRKGREGKMSQRHPTMEQAIESIRGTK